MQFRVSALKNLIMELTLSGSLSMAQVSKEVGMSRRTLQRRLSEHGLTFRDLVSQARRDLAQGLLSNTDMPVQDIANLLGYRRPSAFARAFAQWTGQSPRKYRGRAQP